MALIGRDGPSTSMTFEMAENPINVGKSLISSAVSYESSALFDKQGTGEGVDWHMALLSALEAICVVV